MSIHKFEDGSCGFCDCYINLEFTNKGMRVGRRTLYPGERYCISHKIRKFRQRDARTRPPYWCPKRHRLEISVYSYYESWQAFYFNTHLPGHNPRSDEYVFRCMLTTGLSASEFIKRLTSENTDHYDLLDSYYPKKKDIFLLDNGLSQKALLYSGARQWTEEIGFNAEKCDNGIFGSYRLETIEDSATDPLNIDSQYCIINCNGIIMGYFAENRFRMFWNPPPNPKNIKPIHDQVEAIIDRLQDAGFLGSFVGFEEFCHKRPWASVGNMTDNQYGFYIKAESITLYLLCVPVEDASYHVKIFCYENSSQ